MWIKFDDAVTSHPKVLRLVELAGYEAFFGWVALIGWTARHRTVGHFTEAVVAREGVKPKHLYAMLAAGLVEENSDGFKLHDAEDYLPAKDHTAAERMRRYRERRRNENA